MLKPFAPLAYGCRAVLGSSTGSRRAEVKPEVFLCDAHYELARKDTPLKLTGAVAPADDCYVCRQLAGGRVPLDN
jgi:hypothetical protein